MATGMTVKLKTPWATREIDSIEEVTILMPGYKLRVFKDSMNFTCVDMTYDDGDEVRLESIAPQETK